MASAPHAHIDGCIGGGAFNTSSTKDLRTKVLKRFPHFTILVLSTSWHLLVCCERCRLQDMTHAVGSLYEAAFKAASNSCHSPVHFAVQAAECCLAAQHSFLEASQVRHPSADPRPQLREQGLANNMFTMIPRPNKRLSMQTAFHRVSSAHLAVLQSASAQ